MKIITISREFGSGGRELGKRLSDPLGFDYYDREIIEAIAGRKGMDEGFVEKKLDSHVWKSIPLTFRNSFSGAAMLQSPQVSLLLEQKKVVEDIAAEGRDCVIVGRNADVILKVYLPLSIFVCSDMDAKAFFMSLNDGLTSALISFLRTLLFQAAAVLILPLLWGIDGIWMSMIVAELAAAAVSLLFLAGKKKKYQY